jgi:putative adenylate-forming enzyme
VSVIDLAQILAAYAGARKLQRLPDRAALQRHQAKRLAKLLEHVARRAPYYSAYRGLPHPRWPIIDKRIWMDRFDDINTLGARLEPLMADALEQERTRDFTGGTCGLSVGLSTGTSGSRGLFVATRAERNRWAGVMLASMLGGSLLRRQRIALLLRAGNSLYDRIGGGRLAFRFFDLAAPWDQVADSLRGYQPTLLVAPAQALRLLAGMPASLRPSPARVVSCAEVLEPSDRAVIEAAFAMPVEQIYQATEGFLGATCARGKLHLNETHYLIEREYFPDDPRCFTPTVTDLYRRAQPVIRYRLNDMLRLADTPCPCGSPTTVLDAIGGRADDLLYLPTPAGKTVAVFPDLLSRVIVAATPELGDFEVEELAVGRWRIGTNPLASLATRERLQLAVAQHAQRIGGAPPALEFSPLAARTMTTKLRRVRGSARAA